MLNGRNISFRHRAKGRRSENFMKPELKTESSSSKKTGILRSLKQLEGFSISAKDGHIGKVHDFFFDDQMWAVRYLVADTGHWLPGRKVLLLTPMLVGPDMLKHSLVVSLTREQVKTSPDVDTDKPVSRIREIELHTHYNWPFHWGGVGAWPGSVPPIEPIEPPVPFAEEDRGNNHLRSVRAMMGYEIQAIDGEVGMVDDFVVDDKTWRVRHLILRPRKWMTKQTKAISPDSVAEPDMWSEKTLKLKMTREQVLAMPAGTLFTEGAPPGK